MNTDEAYFVKQNAKMRAEDALRQRLMQAAIDCVAEHGFSAASTDAIAKRAELSAGTLYRFYPSKSILLKAALEKARQILRGDGAMELAGDLLREQLRDLWNRASQNALASPAAFHYWRLYRATPLDTEWGFPAEMRLGPFNGVPTIMRQIGRAEHRIELDGWQAVAQWVAAVQFALAPARANRYDLPAPVAAPTTAQVLAYCFDAYWTGLGLDDKRPWVHYAYIY